MGENSNLLRFHNVKKVKKKKKMRLNLKNVACRHVVI